MTAGSTRPKTVPPRVSIDPQIAGALAGLVIHDLRNMLAVAESSALLAENHLDDRPFAERHLRKIRRQIRKAQDLSTRCLAVAGGEALDLSVEKLGEVFDDASGDLSVPEGLRVLIDEPARAIELPCERLLFARVLANLLWNAIEAMLPRGAGVVRVEAEAAAGAVVVRVHDDGPGMPEALAFTGVTTKPDGNGLGLLVARAVVLAHRGGIQVRATPAGTTFEITIPTG